MILMEPLISLCLVGEKRIFSAGDELVAEYQFDALAADEIQSVEASVLWFTEGKGEEDLGVHFFERRVPGDADHGDLRILRRFSTQLPSSPLSYSGAIFSVRWCVRVRLFLRPGSRRITIMPTAGSRELVQEVPFVLGAVPPLVLSAAAAAGQGEA